MKYILIADDKYKTPSFFPLWEVILFFIFMTFLLMVFFPRHLLKTVLDSRQPSEAALTYLYAFKRQYPNDLMIRYAMIEQEAELEKLNKAQQDFAELEKLAPPQNAEEKNQRLWLSFLILQLKTYQSPINTPTRISYLKQLSQLSKTLSDAPLKTYQLKALADTNLALGQAAFSLKIYSHLLESNALTTPAELAQGGNIAMQNNAHRASAKFYWAAYNKAIATQDKKKYALLAIKALWGGNYVHEAIDLVEALPDDLITDRATLLYISHLALAANRPVVAQHYAVKALLARPHD